MSRDEFINIANFKVRLQKSQRAKHILLKQNTKGEIVLTYPRFCPKIMAISFAKKQAAWIHAHIKYGHKERVFCPNETITLLGIDYVLQSGRVTEQKENTIFISGAPEFFHRRVCSYAQKVLLPYIQKRVSMLIQKLNVKPGRITLRNTSSRWGSCSSIHNLSFCWKIAFAPLDVIDYLVAHEVAHLVHMNHSDRFWALVDSLTDKRIFAENWLKKHGRDLQSIR
ncbi:MAG: M48 family metallopeptidase [Alphaproteobacteria bacterium]|nr:M48 family metallopeptidase [Alphaproteobacteria bacterium]